jgi:ataxin-3
MAAFQENPEYVPLRKSLSYCLPFSRNQAAFVLNLSSHWLPLRRFASSPNRWYNLNSFLQHPEWISPTYLKMVLQQAEEEGYSVFVVRSLTGAAQEEAMTFSLLPECQADLIGLEIGDPTGRDGAMGNSKRRP